MTRYPSLSQITTCFPTCSSFFAGAMLPRVSASFPPCSALTYVGQASLSISLNLGLRAGMLPFERALGISLRDYAGYGLRPFRYVCLFRASRGAKRKKYYQSGEL